MVLFYPTRPACAEGQLCCDSLMDRGMPAQRPSRTHHWLWPLLLLLGGSVATLAWIVLALGNERQSSWMAVVAALQVTWMLHLGTLPRGRMRLAITLASIVLICLLANWGIIAGRIGMMMGLDLLLSAQRLGPHLAWTYANLFNGLGDICWILASLLIGTWLARPRRRR